MHGLYVDDMFLLSLDRARANAIMRAALARYEAKRLPASAKKILMPTGEPVKVIGFMVDGERGCIYLDAKGSLELLSQTLAILRQGSISGHGLSQLLGRWTWSAMLRRPTLSLLQHSFDSARSLSAAHSSYGRPSFTSCCRCARCCRSCTPTSPLHSRMLCMQPMRRCLLLASARFHSHHTAPLLCGRSAAALASAYSNRKRSLLASFVCVVATCRLPCSRRCRLLGGAR